MAREASALAMLEPASGPRPLLARITCSRGKWEEKNFMRGAWTVDPKALSERFMVCKLG